jgi:hypothetical protein
MLRSRIRFDIEFDVVWNSFLNRIPHGNEFVFGNRFGKNLVVFYKYIGGLFQMTTNRRCTYVK